MKKIDDSKIYLSGAIATLVVALALAAVSFYSILLVEPRVEKLLSATTDIDKNYKQAYLVLRDPQIFGGYGNFDADGLTIKNSLAFFDKRIYFGEEIDTTRRAYLELLLDRREKGSILGRNTMAFFLVLSVIFCALFIQERRSARQ
jgi:hypothetical protein